MKKIHIVIFGIGNVGSTLIDQINKAKSRLRSEQSIDVYIPIVANSRLVFFEDNSMTNTWESDFSRFSNPYQLDEIIQYINENKYDHVIAVDATASSDFVQHYNALIQNGFHIVSANKIANTLALDFYDALRQNLKDNNKKFLYETNVGAGLPIIETVRNVYNSGDTISKIRGVFSGSLSYMFNTFSSEDVPFSEVLSKAEALGLTEPDAREDLSGNDVARKLLILARELNLKVEFQQIHIESLVPKQLNGKTSLNQFKSRIKELDQPFGERKLSLQKDQVLRYIGELNVADETLEVKLVSEEKESALGQLKGSDSLFEIFTEAYGDQPLVIQGAGAGKEVTARGLLSDIIKLSNQLH
ncbi:aspartate kinase [Psychroserpens algicola]|uniref:aspartate kinase n=1 Tax=Psychroserpens algicola TaxID=1719034 RepID=UPI001953208C|nr:aspartate kinase [Psychroserpens algicola]